MADVNDKFPDNVPGPFCVDTQCILCHLCSDTAPDFFAESEDGDHDFVGQTAILVKGMSDNMAKIPKPKWYKIKLSINYSF